MYTALSNIGCMCNDMDDLGQAAVHAGVFNNFIQYLYNYIATFCTAILFRACSH